MEAATIHVYDVSKVLGVNKKLAEKYIIDSDNLTGKKNKLASTFYHFSFKSFHFFPYCVLYQFFAEMCEHNRTVAEKHGNADTVQCWKLAHLIATSIAAAAAANSNDSLMDDEIFAQQIPFPKILLESL